jgi:hypothetical protein
MKKVYSLVLVILATTMSFGQTYDLQIVLTTPAVGATVAPSPNQLIDFNIINAGPDAIPQGDTVFLAVLAFGNNYGLDAGSQPGSVSIIPLPQPIPSGTTIPTSQIGGGANFNSSSVTTGTQQICVFGVVSQAGFTTAAGDPDDSDMDNNLSCYTVSAALLNFVELTLADVLSVYSKENFIEINSANADNLEYSVYGLNGQVVTNGSFYGSTSVSTSGMESGVYLVAVTNGSEVEVTKVFVQ